MHRTNDRGLGSARVSSDAELVSAAAAGHRGAFDELFRRHGQAAWRLAHALVPEPDEAAHAVATAFAGTLANGAGSALPRGDAFRVRVLAATRDAAPGATRTPHRPDQPAGAVAAFAGLPERWRAVIWLSQIERLPIARVGEVLGLGSVEADGLLVQARRHLRELAVCDMCASAPAGCAVTIGALVGHLEGGSLPRPAVAHLARCVPCRDRLAELDDLGSSLRALTPPLPDGVGRAAAHAWARTTLSPAASTKRARTPRPASPARPRRAPRPAGSPTPLAPYPARSPRPAWTAAPGQARWAVAAVSSLVLLGGGLWAVTDAAQRSAVTRYEASATPPVTRVATIPPPILTPLPVETAAPLPLADTPPADLAFTATPAASSPAPAVTPATYLASSSGPASAHQASNATSPSGQSTTANAPAADASATSPSQPTTTTTAPPPAQPSASTTSTTAPPPPGQSSGGSSGGSPSGSVPNSCTPGSSGVPCAGPIGQPPAAPGSSTGTSF